MKKYLLILPLLFFLLAGCIQTKILEDILLIQAIGYDSVNKNTTKATFAYSKFSGSKAGNPQPKFLQAKGITTKGIEEEVNSEAAKPIELGQLRLVVFGKKRAQWGIEHMVDSLIRDPEVGTHVYLSVAENKSADLLTHSYNGNFPVPSMYITNMFEQNTQTQNLPTTNLHVFAYHLYDNSCDSVLPLIGLIGDHAAIKGLALFHKGRYVGKIGTKQMFIFKRLYQDSPAGIYELELTNDGEKSMTAVRQIRSKQSFKIQHVNGIPSVIINVKIEGVIVDKSDNLDFGREETIDLVEKTMEKHFQKNAEKMIKRFQKLGVDPLCIGSKVRSKDRSWEPKRWRKIYPKAKIRVHVNVNIRETGAIE